MHKVVNGKQVELTQEEIDLIEQDRARVAAKDALNEWTGLRERAYGSLAEQLDYIVHHGITKFRDRNKAIKAQYPKPE